MRVGQEELGGEAQLLGVVCSCAVRMSPHASHFPLRQTKVDVRVAGVKLVNIFWNLRAANEYVYLFTGDTPLRKQPYAHIPLYA